MAGICTKKDNPKVSLWVVLKIVLNNYKTNSYTSSLSISALYSTQRLIITNFAYVVWVCNKWATNGN